MNIARCSRGAFATRALNNVPTGTDVLEGLDSVLEDLQYVLSASWGTRQQTTHRELHALRCNIVLGHQMMTFIRHSGRHN